MTDYQMQCICNDVNIYAKLVDVKCESDEPHKSMYILITVHIMSLEDIEIQMQ